MKDRKIFCLNNISEVGTAKFRNGYTLVDSMDEAAGVLVLLRCPYGERGNGSCSFCGTLNQEVTHGLLYSIHR